ncbi:RNA polymerase sigma factor [Actinomadura nitritigenes]|uniref:Nuclear transport factor 2 family protein n=1 Tax=Actinomadura nitritigenes TaxID=134602 RepID=A0ABS3RA14_9ACTN|nr:nuclear transport factor 2 family protein [Actinomadura nitritigenes]MBO2443053.1 nuclear transport factor 2 family protein [Actinomadura nitritigenes]
MTGPGGTVSLAEMLDERRHLLDIAEWMFGADAADRIVHETYRRWYALDDDERAGIAVPRAWLTRVAGGICLDLLATGGHAGSRDIAVRGDGSVRGEVGLRGEVGPRGEVGLRRDQVRRPGPVTDPVAAWLRRHPRPDRSGEALLARHDGVVRRFAAACGAGDAAALASVLAADAIVVSDGGGKVRAAAHPAHGADAVARFMTALLAGRPRTVVTVRSVNGRTGLVLHRTGRAVAVVGVSTAGTAVTAVWIMLNPDKLRRWHHPEHDAPPVQAPGRDGGSR